MVTRTVLLFLLAAQAVNQPTAVGLKISERSSFAGRMERQNTTYFESDRRRREFRASSGNVEGPPLAQISRCDLNQNIELNLEDRQYDSYPLPKWPTKEEFQVRAAKSPPPAEPRKPTILLEITTVDTGERKQLFAYEARHVITTRKQIGLDGNTDGDSETVTDGWYADLPTTLTCEPKSAPLGVSFVTAGRMVDVPTVKIVGKPEAGFALSTKATGHNSVVLPDGSKKDFTSTDEMQVTELYSGPLDPALFDVPKGFTKVDQIRRNPPVPLSLLVQEYWNALKLEVSRIFH